MPAKEVGKPIYSDGLSASSTWYFDMIQAQLDLAKSALAGGYVARARTLIEVVIADCRLLLAELGTGKMVGK